MGTRRWIAGTTRLGAVLALAAGVGVVGSAGAGAATQLAPGPLGQAVDSAAGLVPAPLPSDPTEPVTRVVGTVTDSLKGGAATGSGSGSQPSAQPGQGAGTRSSSPAARPPASRSAAAPGADDDTVVGVDVSARDLLGACVRLTRAGVPVRTTVVVLDRNLIDQLSAVGLPLERLLVPCPAGATTTTTGTSEGSSGTTSAAATTGEPAEAGALGPLAFTGTNVAPMLLLAGGFLAIGIAFLRKAYTLEDVPEAHTEGV